MTKRLPPINIKCPHILHGGDYNPDQWIHTPEIWDEDMRLMKIAGCNAMSVGIFSWMSLEPREGEFDFGWLDTIMDKLADNGVFAILATPSGSKPAWLSEAYPETCRVNTGTARAAWRPPQSLPDIPYLPGEVQDHQYRVGRSIQGPSCLACVACLQ